MRDRAAPKLRWVLSGNAEHWLPVRLSLHVLVTVCLAGLTAMVLWDFFAARFPSPLPADLKVDVVRLVMYVIAGLGGVVALVIAYRRQRLGEAAAALEQAADAREQTKAFNDQFAAAAEQLSSDKAANRLAGVYAMASLADDWDEGRQTCINVLCAYIRMPYDPPEQAPELDNSEARKEHQDRRAEQQVRRTVLDVVGERLRADPVNGKTWHGHDFDFSGAVIGGGDLHAIKVIGGRVSFAEAEFSGGRVSFAEAEFSGGEISFSGAEFSGGKISFNSSGFSGAEVSFSWAAFLESDVHFTWAVFSGGNVYFNAAGFCGGGVYFFGAVFSGAEIHCNGALFSGGQVDFREALFSGGRVDLRHPQDWSTPPKLDDLEGESSIVLLPNIESGQTTQTTAPER